MLFYGVHLYKGGAPARGPRIIDACFGRTGNSQKERPEKIKASITVQSLARRSREYRGASFHGQYIQGLFRVENRGQRESDQIQHMSGESLLGGWVLLQGCTNKHAQLKYVDHLRSMHQITVYYCLLSR